MSTEMLDGRTFVPGINCWTCGRFVGRDGWIEIDHFEMSSEIASVSGECRRCIVAQFAAADEPSGDPR